jgi:hypothetical protein
VLLGDVPEETVGVLGVADMASGQKALGRSAYSITRVTPILLTQQGDRRHCFPGSLRCCIRSSHNLYMLKILFHFYSSLFHTPGSKYTKSIGE